MAFLEKFFGTSVIVNNAGEEKALADISSKYVMIYVSASWCPPCRGFTPQLAEYYNKHKASKDFEVIFYSWDEEEDEFDGYFKKMPWQAVRFADSMPNQEKINGAFEDAGLEIPSIPTVFIFETATGKFVSRKARAQIPKDPEAAEFPYEN